MGIIKICPECKERNNAVMLNYCMYCGYAFEKKVFILPCRNDLLNVRFFDSVLEKLDGSKSITAHDIFILHSPEILKTLNLNYQKRISIILEALEAELYTIYKETKGIKPFKLPDFYKDKEQETFKIGRNGQILLF